MYMFSNQSSESRFLTTKPLTNRPVNLVDMTAGPVEVLSRCDVVTSLFSWCENIEVTFDRRICPI